LAWELFHFLFRPIWLPGPFDALLNAAHDPRTPGFGILRVWHGEEKMGMRVWTTTTTLVWGLVLYLCVKDLLFYIGVPGDPNSMWYPGGCVRVGADSAVNTIKLFMQDPVGKHLFLGISHFLVYWLGMYRWPFVTPNVISVAHLGVACLAAYHISRSPPTGLVHNGSYHRVLAGLLYGLRSCLDVTDGVVFRFQENTIRLFRSGWGTSGFFVDAICDVAGSTIFYLGIVWYFQRNPWEAHDGLADSRRPALPKWQRWRILVSVYVQVCIRSALWDANLHRYTELLEPSNGRHGCGITTPVMKTVTARFLLWMWSISSGDHFLTLAIAAILFNRLWGFLRFSHRWGWYQLGALALLTSVHYVYVVKAVNGRDG
jgi:hypothetical protein